ncbi:MAG: hypothetical protein LBL61_06350 [Elusimicrobiota bacterium]|jgi:hypothetical protein|nr:hypothetical protein [Elusimicrobiota bacterium]
MKKIFIAAALAVFILVNIGAPEFAQSKSNKAYEFPNSPDYISNFGDLLKLSKQQLKEKYEAQKKEIELYIDPVQQKAGQVYAKYGKDKVKFLFDALKEKNIISQNMYLDAFAASPNLISGQQFKDAMHGYAQRDVYGNTGYISFQTTINSNFYDIEYKIEERGHNNERMADKSKFAYKIDSGEYYSFTRIDRLFDDREIIHKFLYCNGRLTFTGIGPIMAGYNEHNRNRVDIYAKDCIGNKWTIKGMPLYHIGVPYDIGSRKVVEDEYETEYSNWPVRGWHSEETGEKIVSEEPAIIYDTRQEIVKPAAKKYIENKKIDSENLPWNSPWKNIAFKGYYSFNIKERKI